MVVDYSLAINKFTLLDAYPLPNIDEQVSEIAKGTVFSILDLKSAYYQLPLCPETDHIQVLKPVASYTSIPVYGFESQTVFPTSNV